MRRLFLFAAALACRAQDPATIKVDVDLVTVALSASGRDAAPVKDLRREDFTILDNGQPREIQYFWQESNLPLTVGLVADVSGSQVGLVRKHRDTISRFLRQVIGPQDRAFLVTVGGDVKLMTDLTASIDELLLGVDRIEMGQKGGVQLGEPCRGEGAPRRRFRRGCGGTALWNGVYAAARLKLKPLTGRKALIVLSDGMDTGSFHSLTEAIEAAQGADTLVYTIRYLGLTTMMSPVNAILTTAGPGLRRLSSETGGRAFFSPKDASAVFEEIESELRNLYVLGFTPPEAARDGKFHKLDIKARQPGVKVRARRGYMASRATSALAPSLN
jgi:VWFA-related protein